MSTAKMSEEIPDEIKREIKSFSESNDADARKLAEKYKEVKTEVEESPIPESRVDRIAWNKTRSEFVNSNSLRGGGETVEVWAIGNAGISRWVDSEDDEYEEYERDEWRDYGQWRDQQPKKEVLIANGVVDPEDEARGLGVFIIDETYDIDLGAAKQAFRVLNNFEATFRLGESEYSDGYVLNSTEDTEMPLSGYEPEPGDMEEHREILHEWTDRVPLSGIGEAEHLSMREADNNRLVDWGVDIKRIENASVVSTFIDDGGEFGFYTILDETVVDGSELHDLAIGENQRVDGFSCATEPEIMEYGVGSTCDFYGVIEQIDPDDSPPQIRMRTRGIDPIYPEPIDGEDESEYDSETETF